MMIAATMMAASVSAQNTAITSSKAGDLVFRYQRWRYNKDKGKF